MMATTTIAELRHDHEMIDILARRLSGLLETDATPGQLSTALDHLLHCVADHLAREDVTIYELALSAKPGLSRAKVDQVREEFERLKANWQDYLQFWSPDQIAADRKGFAEASRAMLPRLRNRVKLEESLLVAAALQGEPAMPTTH
ncbi:hemerythrin domain-containing protein [uncultured Sphingomonas sp.]|uniref:hemerythrin domain-containing protein n=1 Tax=uncultured Sphingomonas sp. TaxID=158754 RepID=UPI0025F7B52B|nr:hemerythrin domain-containing protein [uncultured Sphingomonas sp.]